MKIKYLVRRKSGAYYFRKGIPASLREFYNGKREIVKSLGTHNESEAIRKIQPLAALYEADFKTIASTGERDKATALLQSFKLESVPLKDQTAYIDNSDYSTEGSPYAEFMEDLAFKHDTGGEYSPLEPHEQRALDILRGEEKITLLDVKALAEKQALNHKKRVENERFFKYFLKYLPSNVLGVIRRKHIQDAVDKLLADGLKTASVKKPLDYVRKHVRETIHLYELEITNPFDGVKVKGHGLDATKRIPFTLDQLNSVKQSIITKQDLPTAQILGLLADTGCRNGEVGGIRLDHIMLDHDIPHLKIAEQSNRRLKNQNSGRVIPLVGLSLEIAKHIKSNAKAGQIYAFETYNQNDTYNNDNCSAAANKLIKSFSTNHTSHSFRHTLRDRLYDAGVAAYEVDNLAGWTAEKMVDHYGLSKGLERLHTALQQMLTYEERKTTDNNPQIKE